MFIKTGDGKILTVLPQEDDELNKKAQEDLEKAKKKIKDGTKETK